MKGDNFVSIQFINDLLKCMWKFELLVALENYRELPKTLPKGKNRCLHTFKGLAPKVYDPLNFRINIAT